MRTIEELQFELAEAYDRAEARAGQIWDSAWTEIERINDEIDKLEKDNG